LAIFEPQIFENQILTLRETASLLKFSSKTVYRMAQAGDLPFKKVGREYRFLLSQLIDWMKGE
jgi:excisionase family DNA binding protein